jgi:hypothetical protein
MLLPEIVIQWRDKDGDMRREAFTPEQTDHKTFVFHGIAWDITLQGWHGPQAYLSVKPGNGLLLDGGSEMVMEPASVQAMARWIRATITGGE